jgi:hypothetical protein
VVPNGEKFDQFEVLMSGASRVVELMNKYRCDTTSEANKLILLPTTFDPSACVLDEGLMTELERMTSGGETTIEAGKNITGMTLDKVAELMCQPNNGLVIRDRW